jgi:hypothetical protein
LWKYIEASRAKNKRAVKGREANRNACVILLDYTHNEAMVDYPHSEAIFFLLFGCAQMIELPKHFT